MGPELPDYVVHDIVAQVQRALSRFATPGEVRYQNSCLYLEGGGGDVVPRISITPWASDWSKMDDGARHMRAEEAARLLSRERSSGAPRASRGRTIYIDPKLALAVALLCALAFYIFFVVGGAPWSRDNASPADMPRDAGAENATKARGASGDSDSTATPSEATGEARASRVCAATLNRIFQGGSVSVADADGFRVEIALLARGASEPIDTHSALSRFVEDPRAITGSRFIWKDEPGLAPLETTDTVVVTRRTVLGDGDSRIWGVTLAFGGSLVDAYFKEEERGRYFHIAAALSEALGATHVAVYARCFDRPVHALGAWFRGPDTAKAISSLVYFMGTYAQPPHLAKPYYQRPGEQEMDRLYALSSIESKTAPITRAELATLLGKEGGMATGRDGEGVIIAFPFGDGNRASRASRGIAKVAGLGM